MSKPINPLKAAMSGMKPTATTPHLVQKPATKTKQPAAKDPAPSRIGKKAITGHFEPAAARQLKMLGVESDRSIQSLLEEALNDLFRKHGKSPIV
jgi:hypothetical protein